MLYSRERLGVGQGSHHLGGCQSLSGLGCS